MGLEQYRSKRDFSRTPEPEGLPAVAPALAPVFVVQKHAARHLHYDFRLEIDGVLRSWAVPRGPSLDPSERRLAVEVEDHPLAYAGFEGVIPAGEYGGGTVMVWDRGHWFPEGEAGEGWRRGRLRFRLEGEKLRGGWSLVRMAPGRDGHGNWLLIKHQDEFARPDAEIDITELRAESVQSGRGLDEIAAGVAPPVAAPLPAPGGGAVEPGAARAGGGPAPATPSRRPVFPGDGITRGDVVRYYEAVAPRLLPLLQDRPLVLLRCPGDIGGCFLQRHPGMGSPPGLPVAQLPPAQGGGRYFTVGTEAELLALVQAGTVELHAMNLRQDRPDCPDRMVFDLDPDPALAWRELVERAQLLRELLQELALPAFLKLSGGRGVHLEVPLRRVHAQAEVMACAEGVARLLAGQLPRHFTTGLAAAARRGRVCLDYRRNGVAATAVAAYSLRARPGAPVALPLDWVELPEAAPGRFTLRTVPALLATRPDPWQAHAHARVRLPPGLLAQVGRGE